MTPRARQIMIEATMRTFRENAQREGLPIPEHEMLAAVTADVDGMCIDHGRDLVERYRRRPAYRTIEPKALD